MDYPSDTNQERLNRRHFIKSTSLALGASVFTAPYLARGKDHHVVPVRVNRQIGGIVLSGVGATAMPLPGAEVSLYEATSAAPRLLGRARTNASGNFSIQSRPGGWRPDGIFYATAGLGNGLQLVSVIGPALLDFITINELTTVAAGYSFAQFTRHGLLAGDRFGLQIASGMKDNLVSTATGDSSSVMLSSPNGDETNSLRSTRALANLLALFVRNGGQGIDTLFALTTPPGGATPTNLLQALSNIARYPQQNVDQLYNLATEVTVYSPSLLRMPDAWTIVVKVNDTGSDDYLFGGPGNIAFDADGYAWITNNVTQGTPNSSRFSVVLKPNGQPADGMRGTPKSPLLGGGLLGGGYGVGIAPDGHVWFGNFGWGRPAYHPSADGNGSVSEFTRNGHPISGPLGYQGGPVRAQAVVPDAHGNIWIASFGTDAVYVFPHGNPNHSILFQEPAGSAPFDIQIARDGTAWVTNSGGLGPNGPGSIARYALEHGRLRQIFLKYLGHSNKGVALDSQGNAWMASGGDNGVYMINDQGDASGPFNGGGVDAPWGISVDGDDNVWVGNFGPEEANNDFNDSRISKLAGINPATRPPGLQPGDGISPPTGYTLPSAGAQVRLHNGDPLYGIGPLPSYTPLMRITSLPIDRAGNVWAVNNWKPRFDVDIANSGGDGICIFVGAAKPPAWRD